MAERDLSLARNAGFRWVKQSIEWRYVEPHVKGTYEFNEPDRLIDLFIRCCLQNNGELSKRKREELFPMLGDAEVAAMEECVRENYHAG